MVLVFAVRTNSVWGDSNKGMNLIKKVSKFSGKKNSYKSVHYISAVCTMFYIAEAIEQSITIITLP